VFDDEPSKLTPEVVRDVYGADQELDETLTSTAIASQDVKADPESVQIQLAS
jgi:phosphonate transport system ATP-binding protein